MKSQPHVKDSRVRLLKPSTWTFQPNINWSYGFSFPFLHVGRNILIKEQAKGKVILAVLVNSALGNFSSIRRDVIRSCLHCFVYYETESLLSLNLLVFNKIWSITIPCEWCFGQISLSLSKSVDFQGPQVGTLDLMGAVHCWPHELVFRY